VPMPASLADPTSPPTPDSRTAPLPDRSQKVRPADSTQGVEAGQTAALDPLVSSVAETDDMPRAPARTDDWAMDATARSIPVSVQTVPKPPEFRIVLLLLMVGVLTQIAVNTPEKLQAMAADTMELLLSTDIPEARTAPGPGPLVGQLEVISTPSGIELFVDGERHGVTPAQLVLNTGIHEVTLVSPIGTVPRNVSVIPGRPTRFSEAIFNGSLVISSAVEVEVRIDGHELVLQPGSYQLELLNPDDGTHTMHTVEILPGQVTTFDAGAARRGAHGLLSSGSPHDAGRPDGRVEDGVEAARNPVTASGFGLQARGGQDPSGLCSDLTQPIRDLTRCPEEQHANQRSHQICGCRRHLRNDRIPDRRRPAARQPARHAGSDRCPGDGHRRRAAAGRGYVDRCLELRP